MDLPPNPNPPRTMWIDMNSSFARTEQQAHPRLRGVPVGVGKYTNPNGPVISPSVEAKAFGIKTAHTVRACRLLCPEIRIVKSDPPKYREMHRRMLGVFRRWSPDVLAKSIDECCISFEGSPALRRYSMEGIAREIKAEIRDACGEWISVSVGIGTNQFLAKTAAGLVKPDGLETIDRRNLRGVLGGLGLTDLSGINSRYEARLRLAGIHTPLEFLDAPSDLLRKRVFLSVEGWYWHLMLRGYEHRDYDDPARRTFGNSHSVREQTDRAEPNLAILHRLCDMAGRRMRRNGFSCRTVVLTLSFPEGDFFQHLRAADKGLYTTQEIARSAFISFGRQPGLRRIHRIGVQLAGLQQGAHEQLDMFETDAGRKRRSAAAVDAINDRYGEQAVYLAPAHGAKARIDDSISFGSTGDVRQLYEEESAFSGPSTDEVQAEQPPIAAG